MSEAPTDWNVRPLVVGGLGLVGSALTARLEQRFPHTVSADQPELDLTDVGRVELELERLRPTVVINCAAMSDVDACERDPAGAQLVNARAPAELARVCRSAGVRLIHFSTDYVFDGAKQDEYDEDDPPNPVNEYGRSKLMGEQAVLETLVDAVVLRVSFIFGPGRRTFIDKIVAQARAQAGPLAVLDGWVSKPTHVGEIVRGVEHVLTSNVTGLLHLAGRPAASRLAFAREVLRLMGEDPERVTPLDPARLVLPAQRPAATPLRTARFERLFGPVRPWAEWVAEHLRTSAGSVAP